MPVASCQLQLRKLIDVYKRQVEPGYHEYAYVSNGKSNSVSVLDLLQLRNVKTKMCIRDRA